MKQAYWSLLLSLFLHAIAQNSCAQNKTELSIALKVLTQLSSKALKDNDKGAALAYQHAFNNIKTKHPEVKQTDTYKKAKDYFADVSSKNATTVRCIGMDGSIAKAPNPSKLTVIKSPSGWKNNEVPDQFLKRFDEGTLNEDDLKLFEVLKSPAQDGQIPNLNERQVETLRSFTQNLDRLTLTDDYANLFGTTPPNLQDIQPLNENSQQQQLILDRLQLYQESDPVQLKEMNRNELKHYKKLDRSFEKLLEDLTEKQRQPTNKLQ